VAPSANSDIHGCICKQRRISEFLARSKKSQAIGGTLKKFEMTYAEKLQIAAALTVYINTLAGMDENEYDADMEQYSYARANYVAKSALKRVSKANDSVKVDKDEQEKIIHALKICFQVQAKFDEDGSVSDESMHDAICLDMMNAIDKVGKAKEVFSFNEFLTKAINALG